ncbi:hypothetical protein [Maricaulis sp.]|jgi:hypothetical protein|uniref:hypothetical protein n=1 Tax=Maricaulis sp. TaxID=1486257 RepID=UPI002617B8D4|nr:hypothetical protein [Maricaulis sp.]
MNAKYILSGAVLAAGLAAAAAQAQDADAPPAYGSTRLSAGFTEDPTSVGVRAGGAIYAGNAADTCSGYITHQPSYNLDYAAGDTFDLYISAASDADAVLVVNGPDGAWTCNDDGEGTGLNPGIRFENPQSGTYSIWVGTYGSGSGYEPAMLHISELGFFTDNVYSRAPDAGLPPTSGTLRLSSGFADDPRTVAVSAGGDVDASRGTASMCWGHVDQAPDLWVEYDAGNAFDLYVSMQADADTTLVVRGPEGDWHCDDDSAGDLNPGVRIDDPVSGRYAVWAGRYSEGVAVPATVYISELGFLGEVNELDFSLPSNYGSSALDAGFSPDPFNVDLTAGGDVDVNMAIGQNCRGFATTAPDYDITYAAGDFDLYVSATSQGDATLVVNAPDGSWWCDDDSAGDLNPGIRFDNPMSGRYDIWVGTYSSGAPEEATLHISELGFGGEFTAGAELDWTLASNYGGVSLEGGFSPDPYLVDLVAGGPLEAESAADQSCRGHVTQAPDFELTFEPGALDLYISVLSDSDTTLVINDPSGNWVCNDDGSSGVNPGVHFEQPQAGVYDIWVGTYWSGEGADAQLAISELGFHQ